MSHTSIDIFISELNAGFAISNLRWDSEAVPTEHLYGLQISLYCIPLPFVKPLFSLSKAIEEPVGFALAEGEIATGLTS